MSRFLIEREFRDGLNIPLDETGAQLCRNVIDSNAEDGVTWFHSYVTPDRKHTFVFTKRRRPNPKIPQRWRRRCGIVLSTPVRNSTGGRGETHASPSSAPQAMIFI
jgi:hypothetical protein